MGLKLYNTPEVMEKIEVIKSFEESKYTDMPSSWKGWISNYTDKAVLFAMDFDPPRVRENLYWIPFSHIRKSEDDGSVYLSNWICEQKNI